MECVSVVCPVGWVTFPPQGCMLYCARFTLFAEIERSRSSSEAFRRRLYLGAGVFLLNLRYGGKTDEKVDEQMSPLW